MSRVRRGPQGRRGGRGGGGGFEAGDFPDGLTLDAGGGAWVVCVGSNRLYRVGADGTRRMVIDDADDATVQRLEAAFIARTLDRPTLSSARGRRLKNTTSPAFGGPNPRTAHMGHLARDPLATPEHTHVGQAAASQDTPRAAHTPPTP